MINKEGGNTEKHDTQPTKHTKHKSVQSAVQRGSLEQPSAHHMQQGGAMRGHRFVGRAARVTVLTYTIQDTHSREREREASTYTERRQDKCANKDRQAETIAQYISEGRRIHTDRQECIDDVGEARDGREVNLRGGRQVGVAHQI